MTEARIKDIDANQWADLQKLIGEIREKDCPICGQKKLGTDVSMCLIQCEGCGIAFEYRYDRGVIPFHTIIESGT